MKKAIEQMISYIQLLRPKHWIKNLLIFAPLIFSLSFEQGQFNRALIVFVGYSLLASSVYVLNDLVDIKNDQSHPIKSKRPIASGLVGSKIALVVALILLCLAAVAAICISERILITFIIYLLINIAYTFWAKNIAIIDVMIVALGFVLRVIAGALAISVAPSQWILLFVFFFALFLAFGKRRNEMTVLANSKRVEHRQSIKEYTEGFIGQMLSLTAGISLVFYSLYTIDPLTIARLGTDNLIYTTPIVVFGVFRYLFLIYNRELGGDPVVLILQDRGLLLSFGLYTVAVFYILTYFPSINWVMP